MPVVDSRSSQQYPLWAGTLNHLYVWGYDKRTFLLMPDRASGEVTRDQFDGQEGWPFGKVEGYAEALSERASTWYETTLTDLGRLSNVDVVARITPYEAPAPAVPSELGVDVYVYAGASDSRQSMTPTRLPADDHLRLEGVRYLAFRLHLKTWRGAAVARFAPEIRTLGAGDARALGIEARVTGALTGTVAGAVGLAPAA